MQRLFSIHTIKRINVALSYIDIASCLKMSIRKIAWPICLLKKIWDYHPLEGRASKSNFWTTLGAHLVFIQSYFIIINHFSSFASFVLRFLISPTNADLSFSIYLLFGILFFKTVGIRTCLLFGSCGLIPLVFLGRVHVILSNTWYTDVRIMQYT